MGGVTATALTLAALVLLRRRRRQQSTKLPLSQQQQQQQLLPPQHLCQQPDHPFAAEMLAPTSFAAPLLLSTTATPVAAAAQQQQQQQPDAPRTYTEEQLSAATNGFSDECKIDEGAFGVVFRGVLGGGLAVAIKVLKPESAVMKVAQKHEEFVGAGSFRKELDVLTQYRHPNIVCLLGHCLSDGASAGVAQQQQQQQQQQQCLVFEFMAGGSLDNRLQEARTVEGKRASQPLTVAERFDIASDVARGLEYLHLGVSPPLIHQDVKSGNILLAEVDGRVVAKVADFGTARYAPTLQVEGQTHHSTQAVIGTRPYMPMEYQQMGHVSEKTDTYAFGVVLCELLTGLGPANYDTGELLSATMQDVLPNAERELPAQLDANLGGGTSGGGWPLARALALARIAHRCIQPLVSKRCVIADVRPGLDELAGRHCQVSSSSASAAAAAARNEFSSAHSAELRKDNARALVGKRVRVFDAVGGAAGREGTVLDLKSTIGGSTKHIIMFEGNHPPKLESVLLQKSEGASKGTRFHLLSSE